MGLEDALDSLARDRGFVRNVTNWRRLPPQPGKWAALPDSLAPDLGTALREMGIEQLYSHQAMAWQAAAAGQHLLVVTPTASGKTLCYNLPVLQTLLRHPNARALYLFPTKALSQDQIAELGDLNAVLPDPIPAGVYDGDTPASQRPTIRRKARIVITNPDMLHQGILPHHTKWMALFQDLRYVVLDELHTYRGVFGSHVANVMRRLKRICAFYGAHPQFICCSATIGNPRELASRLIEDEVRLIDEDGSPKGERHLVFYNPPLLDANTGLRRGAMLEALSVSADLLQHGAQIIAFTRSRQTTEILLTYLRDELAGRNLKPDSVRGYRGGYLPLERRSIERGLREGSLRGVVCTNALELGIDIGHLEACVMVGYPGTIASTWQQAGRAGRRAGVSISVLVASADPLDQYMVMHPEYFFGRSPENALISPDNAAILTDHIRCAAFELPFRDGELLGRAATTGTVLADLEQQGTLRHAAETWYWMSDAYPAESISLRTTGADRFTIESWEEETPVAIGTVDRSSVPMLLHEGAIYMHEGRQYLVDHLDWEQAHVTVKPVSVDYYTDASSSTDVEVLSVLVEDTNSKSRGLGNVRIRSSATGYRRIKLYTHETLSWGDIDLPEQTMETTAYWLTIPEPVANAMRAAGAWDIEPILDYGPNWTEQRERVRERDAYRCRRCNAPERSGRQHDVHHLVPFRDFGYVRGENTRYLQANELGNLVTLCHNCHAQAETSRAGQSALHGLAYALSHLAPLFLMAAPQDLGVSVSVRAEATLEPTVYLYDQFPGGVGFSERLFELHWQLLRAARDLVQGCPCQEGCPSCVGPVEDSTSDLKAQTVLLAKELLRLAEPPIG